MLPRLQRDKRKKIQQERRRVADAGVQLHACTRARRSTEPLWDFFYRCYTLTYQAHHSTPYLTRDFFARMARTMPEHWLMFVARRGGEPIAASLIAIDPQRGAAWGRYWGCTEHVPCLHFEACYYQPLAWCLAQRLPALRRRRAGRAQDGARPAAGGHRIRRTGCATRASPRAVADFLAAEGAGIGDYVDELRERNPFKSTT